MNSCDDVTLRETTKLAGDCFVHNFDNHDVNYDSVL